MKLALKKKISLLVLSAILTSSCVILKADAAAQQVAYLKYDCTDNTTEPYTLSLDEQAVSQQARGIVGEDNRVVDGSSGIVYFSNGTTGFIVGDHTIATAAHCVNVTHAGADIKAEFEDSNYFRQNLKAYLYTEGGSPESGLPLEIVEIHVPSSYVSSFSVANDYALVTVEDDLSGYTQFNLGVPYNVQSDEFAEIDLFVTGIPQTTNTNQSNYYLRMYTGKGNESPDHTSTSEVLYYTCDTTGGNSGSPVYVACEYTIGTEVSLSYTAVAVHSSADYEAEVCVANYGSAITASKMQFYGNNSYVGY